ncbi:MAG: helix-turn-helix domain-containing protein [Kiritimatiellia bacterium]|jgi:AraC-like DNA-binding protein
MRDSNSPPPSATPIDLMQDAFAPILLKVSRSRRIVSSFRCDIRPLRTDPQQAWRRSNSHTPPQREVFLVLSGEVLYGLNGKVHPGRPGDLFLYDIGDVHDKSLPPTSPDSIVLCFQIYKDFTYAYFARFEAGRRTISSRMLFADAGTTPLLNRAWDGVRGGKETREAAIVQTLCAIDYILAEVARFRHADPEQIAIMPGTDAKLSAQQVVGLVMTYIDERSGRECNLKEITRFSGYSAAHINRIFKANLGYSITEHANAWRVNRMRDMLRAGATMKEVAFDLGFSSQPAFSRWKRKHNL